MIIYNILFFVIGTIAGAIISHHVEKYLVDYEKSRQPKFITNITEIEPLKNQDRIENFKFLFSTYNGKGMIVAARTGFEKLNKKYGFTLIPDKLIAKDNQKEYNITLKNLGKTKANNVSLNINSLGELKILERNSLVKSVDCNNNNGNVCILEIPKISPEEEVYFNAISDNPGIRDIKITINNEEKENSTNWRQFYAKTCENGMVLEMNGEKLNLPEINYELAYKMFYYQPNEKKWIEIK